jgi:serine-type D-Ala-D-Ala carboxypeptidase (penicillin-binding protein 5/6)
MMRLCLLIAALATGLWQSAIAQSVQTSAPIALLYDEGTKSVLFEKAAEQPHPPASLVKLLTADVIFDALAKGETTLETEYRISEDVWRRGGAPSGAAAMYAPINSRVSVANLLQGLLVMSGNDAALALAEGLAGGESAFVARMNTRAAALGLTKSAFRTATGFTHPEQRVTARDMLRLAIAVREQHAERYALFSQREFTWNNIRQTNRNPLLGMNIGADGFKTGNTSEAGFNLIASAAQDNRRLYLVLMGADSAITRSAEARKLLEWGFRNFENRTVFRAGAALTETIVVGGLRPTVEIGLAADVNALMPKSAQDIISAQIITKQPLKAPVTAGQEVGRLVIKRGNIISAEVPLVTLQDSAQGSLGKRALDNSWNWFVSLFRRRSAA